MRQRKNELTAERATALLERHWKWAVLAVWLLFCAWFVFNRWTEIRIFNLGDTDDNMRMMQVRGLLHGQGWYDLEQHRLAGSNIHWSRLVDLPLAGLILLLRPLVGGVWAEKAAVAIAPLLPYLLLLTSVALTTRRLVDQRAYPLAFLALFFAGSTNGMFMPERIDHHGWQLALLALGVAALADPRKLRGGITLGAVSALSLAIGLEMLIYLAIAGAAMALFWVADREERARLGAYAVTFGGGAALAFLLFASNANRLPVCDALSPVWLSNALLGTAVLFALAWWSPPKWPQRLAVVVVGGLIIAAFHASTWPHCLNRLEGVSDEVYQLWLSHVREARPIYRHGWRVATLILALPATGLVGWLVLIWRNRIDRDRLRRTVAAALPGFAATVLLFWQTRTGPAAQMLAVPGAVALVWVLAPLVWNSRFAVVRVVGVALVVIAGLGAAVPLVIDQLPEKKPTAREAAIGKANRLCNSLWAYRPIALLPKGTVFTFVDFAPRLITVTHHNGITGPYHRNGEQIADVMNAFRTSSPDQARALIGKYRANYVMTCPNSSTTTIFMSETPRGFYAQLERGQVPAWLTPLPLPKNSPFKIWRVAGQP